MTDDNTRVQCNPKRCKQLKRSSYMAFMVGIAGDVAATTTLIEGRSDSVFRVILAFGICNIALSFLLLLSFLLILFFLIIVLIFFIVLFLILVIVLFLFVFLFIVIFVLVYQQRISSACHFTYIHLASSNRTKKYRTGFFHISSLMISAISCSPFVVVNH